jgi:hypothetical protein
MTLRLKIELTIALVLLGALGVGAKVWLDEHDNRIKAEASVAAQAQLQQQYQQQVSDLAKRIDAREAAYNAQSEQLKTQFQQASTPQQTAQLVASLMGLKTPITITTPSPTAATPNPQPVAQVSAIDFPQAKAYIQECEQCKLERLNFQADAADRQAQAALAQKQIDSLKKENASLQTAVKGGSFFQRLGKATKYLILGGAAALVATCGTGHCK